VEGLEGRVTCHEHLLALRRGVGPMGRGSSGGDAVDKKVGPLNIFTCGRGEESWERKVDKALEMKWEACMS